jgi:hypothetical protein
MTLLYVCVFVPVPCWVFSLFFYYGCAYNLRSGFVIVSALVFLPRIALAIWGHLSFHMKFSSTKISFGREECHYTDPTGR